MQQTANVAQLKAKLSEYLRAVKTGAEVTIMERGVPVARLVPLTPDERRATREQRLIRAGVLRPPFSVRGKLSPPAGDTAHGTGALDFLLKEREEGY